MPVLAVVHLQLQPMTEELVILRTCSFLLGQSLHLLQHLQRQQSALEVLLKLHAACKLWLVALPMKSSAEHQHQVAKDGCERVPEAILTDCGELVGPQT